MILLDYILFIVSCFLPTVGCLYLQDSWRSLHGVGCDPELPVVSKGVTDLPYTYWHLKDDFCQSFICLLFFVVLSVCYLL